MTSQTSGLQEFNLDVDEIIESALGPLGGEHVSGQEAKDARRELNLILIALQNKGVPLSALAKYSRELTDGLYSFDMPGTGASDVLRVNYKKNGVETPLSRVGILEYTRIPNKTKPGTPSIFSTERSAGTVGVKFWPAANSDTDTLEVLYIKRIDDVTAAYQKLNISYRYLPLITQWLTYRLCLHRQGIPQDLRVEFKNNYLETLVDTFEEDRERVSCSITPGGISGT